MPAYPRIAARGAVTGGGAEVTEAQSQLRPGPGQLVSLGPGGCTPPRGTQVLKQPSPSSCPSGLTHPEHVPSRLPPPRARGQPLSIPLPQRVQEPAAELRTQVPEPVLGRPLGRICTLGDLPPRGLPQGATPHLPVQWGPRSPGRHAHTPAPAHPDTRLFLWPGPS